MEDLKSKIETLFASTQTDWKERTQLIEDIKSYIENSGDNSILPVLEEHHKEIALQFRDLR